MSGAAGYDGAREQMRPLTDRTLQMADEGSVLRCALGMDGKFHRCPVQRQRQRTKQNGGPDRVAEVEISTKVANGSSSPPAWWEPSAPGATSPIRIPAVPDQDALCYRSRPGTDRGVVVVCAGAGRAAEGRIGAPAAAAAALESCSELTESPNQDRPNLLRCTVTTVRQTVIQFAATSGISLREYAATLTALIQANGRAASAQVGDGAGVVGADAGWMLTSEPQRGQHANETWFITQEGAIYRGCVSAEIIGVALPQQNRYPTQVVASNKMLPKIGEAIGWEEASARWQNRNCWRRSETATELHRSGRKAGFWMSSSRN